MRADRRIDETFNSKKGRGSNFGTDGSSQDLEKEDCRSRLTSGHAFDDFQETRMPVKQENLRLQKKCLHHLGAQPFGSCPLLGCLYLWSNQLCSSYIFDQKESLFLDSATHPTIGVLEDGNTLFLDCQICFSPGWQLYETFLYYSHMQQLSHKFMGFMITFAFWSEGDRFVFALERID